MCYQTSLCSALGLLRPDRAWPASYVVDELCDFDSTLGRQYLNNLTDVYRYRAPHRYRTSQRHTSWSLSINFEVAVLVWPLRLEQEEKRWRREEVVQCGCGGISSLANADTSGPSFDSIKAANDAQVDRSVSETALPDGTCPASHLSLPGRPCGPRVPRTIRPGPGAVGVLPVSLTAGEDVGPCSTGRRGRVPQTPGGRRDPRS
ncbi:hypothetical protein C2E23DRAFT_241200 [Lenzites betulinus]|nr:hypothetical protein C2E23DRAFT_241200 [Lenzites betulinus]